MVPWNGRFRENIRNLCNMFAMWAEVACNAYSGKQICFDRKEEEDLERDKKVL